MLFQDRQVVYPDAQAEPEETFLSTGQVMKSSVVTIFICASLTSFAATTAAQAPTCKESRYVPGEVIVQFHAGTSNERIREIIGASGVATAKVLGAPHSYLLRFSKDSSIEELISGLQKYPEILYAHPNRIVGLPGE